MARLTFLGAARTVTGSQYLLEAGGRLVLVDSGMFQGDKALRQRNWSQPEFPVAKVDAIVLTHTHLDHLGRVPRLVKLGFRGAIYCTPPTLELAEILLLDAAHLQEEDADYLNRKGLTTHAPALPLFNASDVQEALKLFRAVPLGRAQAVNEALSFSYREAGHLLGAASADVSCRRRDSVRGGLQRRRRRFGRSSKTELAPDADYLVIESAVRQPHASRNHRDRLV